jgi:methyl-accepting chemotaxis protein
MRRLSDTTDGQTSIYMAPLIHERQGVRRFHVAYGRDDEEYQMIADPSYVLDRRRNEGDRAAHTASRSIPFWLHTILSIPIELKVLGANLVIMAAAVLMLFGPLRLDPTRLTDAFIVVAALGVGAVVNFVLVRLALRPVKDLTRVAWLVSEGLRGARVPASIAGDSELTQLSTTINQLLDDLVTDRVKINKLARELATAAGRGDGHMRGADSFRLSGIRR